MRRTQRFVAVASAATVLGIGIGSDACARRRGTPSAAARTSPEPRSHAADTACVEALYWVEYLQAGPGAKRITDSLERTHRLGVISRTGGEGAFAAALRPQLADSLRHHRAIASVERATAWCKRIARISYPAVPDGPPPGVHRSPRELRPLPEGSITDPWMSDLDSVRAVVRSPQEWRSLWPSETPRFPVPSINFAREMILVAAAGERGAGHGHLIRIDSAFVASDTFFAVVREYAPGPYCGTTRMVVRPMHAVSVTRSKQPVVFIDRGTVTRHCPSPLMR